MKPVAVVNVAMLSNTSIDQPKKLHEAGYTVVFVNDGPAITLHQAAPGRRERIATALLGGIYACPPVDGRAAVDAALRGADLLIKELDK